MRWKIPREQDKPVQILGNGGYVEWMKKVIVLRRLEKRYNGIVGQGSRPFKM